MRVEGWIEFDRIVEVEIGVVNGVIYDGTFLPWRFWSFQFLLTARVYSWTALVIVRHLGLRL